MAEVYDAESGERLDGDAARDALVAGRASVAPSSRTVVRDDAGNRIEIPADQLGTQLAKYVARGYTIESDEQAAAADLAIDATHSPIQGFAEAGVRGATLGLSDVAGAVISPEYAQRANARREALGGYATAAEIVGSVAPALVSGGAFTPAGALARATESAGAQLERAMIGRGVGAATSKLAGLASEGLADGLVSGVGQQLSEDSLGGTEITAERLAAAGGMGALLGLGAGGAVGGAGLVARKAGRGIADKIAARRAGVALPEAVEEIAGAADAGFFRHLSDDARGGLATIGSDISGADRSAIKAGLDDSTLRADWLQQDTIKAGHAKDLQSSLQAMNDTDHLMKDIGAGEAKIETIQRDIKPGRIYAEQALGEARPVLQEYRAVVEEMKSAMPAKKWAQLDRELSGVGARVENEFSRGNSAGGYLTLERYKRVLDARVKNTKLGTGDFLDREVANSMHQASRDAGDRIRNLLENEDIFGELGRKQAERNALWHDTLQTGKEYHDALTAKTGESVNDDDWWIARREINGDKAAKFVDDLTSTTREQNINRVRAHIEKKKALYETVIRNGEVPPDMLSHFKSAIEGMDRGLQTFDVATDRLTKIQALDLVARADSEASGFLSPGTGALIGGFAAGPIGAAVGAAAGGVAQLFSRPGAMIRNVAKLEALSRRLGGVTQSLQSKTASAVQALARPAKAFRAINSQTLERRAVTAGTRSAVTLFGSDRKSRLDKAKQIETRLSDYQKDPSRLMHATGYQISPIRDVAPRVALATVQHAAKSLEFLRSKLPSPGPPNPLTPAAQLSTWTDQAVDSFSRYVAAVKDPTSVVDDLKAGQLSPEGVEVLRQLYPQLYDTIRETAMIEIAKHQTELPYASVLQLSLLLDIPGHPTLDQQFMAAIQDLWVGKAEKTKQGPSPSNTRPIPIRTGQTESERLMGGLSQ